MNELIKTYLQIPSERLGVLLDNDFNILHKIHKRTRAKWVRDKKCSCVNNLKEGRILICNHIEEEIKRKSKEINKRIEKKNSILMLRNLLKFQRNQDRFNTFKIE
jgi:rRNA processing protein Krr1/Pno1